jgi:ribosomal protein S18 acetylase RimI-like enzyme
VPSRTAPIGSPSIPAVQDLTPRDIGSLRFGLWSRLTNAEVQREISGYPGRSAWLPETSEYAVVTPWRHRPEIAQVLELSAVRHPSELLRAVVERCEQFPTNLVLSIEIDEIREPAFYGRAGFRFLEEVITYELDCRVVAPYTPGRLTFRILDVQRPADLELLVQMDHATFPWLWWNSEDEFRSYADLPGVELLVGFDGPEPVSYLGITSYLGWGHLDRIAVLPHRQGSGFGAEALAFAVARLRQSGALKVGLSTQRKNSASQRLYERFGFKRGIANDYKLYGSVLHLPDGVRDITVP